MEEKRRDNWDKADIILKPVGGLLTALAVTALGFFGSRALDRKQAEDNKVRLYTELLSKRQESETAFRKDMFSSMFSTFLVPARSGYEQQILNVELLSYNFNEDVDLSPIFNLLYSQITDSKELRSQEYLRRLEAAAATVKARQIGSLEGAGVKVDTTINLQELEKMPTGINVLDVELRPKDDLHPALRATRFKVDALLVDRTRREVRLKLEVQTPLKNNSGVESDTTYSIFWVGPFDFPMTTNTSLPHGQRCAIVMRQYGNISAELTLVYFSDGWRAARVIETARSLNVQSIGR